MSAAIESAEAEAAPPGVAALGKQAGTVDQAAPVKRDV